MVYPNAVFVGNSPNQDPRRQDVSQVIIHHTASTGDVRDILNMFMQDNSRSVSANFLVAQNGDVYEVVNPDTGRAWTTGSGPGGTISPDHSAITMEVMDETGAPGWTISEAAQESVSQIIAWAAARYGFTPVRGVNVRGHREMPGQSTACPGGMPLDSVTARGIDILNGVKKEGFLMSLSDEDQNNIAEMARAFKKAGGVDDLPGLPYSKLAVGLNVLFALRGLTGTVNLGGYEATWADVALSRVKADTTRKDILAAIKGIPVSEVADIDEKALALELAPLISAGLGTLTASEIDALAKAVADEQSKRLAA
jgi:N-acetyl-anhydromuramyl-L-alanine amidase AmpD